MKKSILIILLTFFSVIAYAQDDYQLALEYYRNDEYEKASVLFEKLYQKRDVKFYFDYYLECLVKMEDFKTAEKKIKKYQKKNKDELTFGVDLGYIYAKQDQREQAEKEFKKVIKDLPSDKTKIVVVANSFISKKEYDWAEKTYIEGKKLTNLDFYQELARLYAIQRKNDLMIDAYLNFLEGNRRNLTTVKSQFQWQLDNDANNEFYILLKGKLLGKIQATRNDVFNELLIWLYSQKKDFANAIIQAKALDRRNNEIGVRVYNIAKLAQENEDYNTANEGFTYVVNKGSKQPYYHKAKSGLLEVMYLQIENNDLTAEDEIKNVEKQYLETINELGINSNTIELIIDLAQLQAFYLNKTTEAQDLLNEALSINGLTNEMKGKCQIKLADIMLLNDNSWDAILTYAKAEDANKHNEIGDEAKLKKAKVYYFIGNFSWSQSQLDVLKGSTSKLIANDAFELANIINDNIGDDSLYTPLELYSQADFMFFQHKFNEANKLLDTILNKFAYHSMADEAYFLKYKISMQSKSYENAKENLLGIIENHPRDILADRAVFLLAQLYENKLNDTEKAKEFYKMLLLDYTGSIYVVRARLRFRTLNGDFDNQEQ